MFVDLVFPFYHPQMWKDCILSHLANCIRDIKFVYGLWACSFLEEQEIFASKLGNNLLLYSLILNKFVIFLIEIHLRIFK